MEYRFAGHDGQRPEFDEQYMLYHHRDMYSQLFNSLAFMKDSYDNLESHCALIVLRTLFNDCFPCFSNKPPLAGEYVNPDNEKRYSEAFIIQTTTIPDYKASQCLSIIVNLNQIIPPIGATEVEFLFNNLATLFPDVKYKLICKKKGNILDYSIIFSK